jgi:Succinate dehydrogenase/fumarate reductase, flavoprotein subunit
MSKQGTQKTKEDMSRRGFLKASGLAMGTMALGLTAGCGDNVTRIGSSSNTTTDPNLPAAWDAEADVVIVGFGGAAAAAMITYKEKGINAKLLVLEAQDEDKKPIGQRVYAPSTYKCGGGTWLGAGTADQTASGFTETADEFYTTTLAAVGVGGDAALIKAYSENIAEVYSMLKDAGVTYGNYQPLYTSPPSGGVLIYGNERRLVRDGKTSKAVPHMHMAEKKKDANGNYLGTTAGNTLWVALETKALASMGTNDKVLYNTRATRLITNADGRVVGVAAVKTKAGETDDNGVPVVDESTTYYYKAKKAVLFCNGGFINNKDLLELYQPKSALCNGGQVPSYAGNCMDIGTGLLMGQAIGAGTKSLNNAENWCPIYYETNNFVKAIIVNPSGERFAPEDLSGSEMGAWIVNTYPSAWIIFDQKIYDSIGAATAQYLVTHSANTIDELATKISAPYLGQTLARYNTFAAAGKDDQFNKDPSVLQKIETGPFYAYKREINRVFAQTTGGLRINPKSQVLTAKGSVITGFYAAGSVTANVNSQYYVGGGSTSGAFAFGRIAIQQIAKETAWDAS